ncbi:MAG: YecA family protein [Desulfomonilaceae bacterium]
MKKIKSPWYAAAWLIIWTVALGWFVSSGMFNERETIGLVLVWLVFCGITVYLLVKYFLAARRLKITSATQKKPLSPPLNGPCPCGSGLKYKRCCYRRTS